MVDLKFINNLIKKFKIDSECIAFSELQSGHINDTYRITTVSEKHFVLQRLNTNVFKNSNAVINNKLKVSDYLNKEFKNIQYQSVTFIKTINDSIVFVDKSNGHWSVMTFIENSQTFDVATNFNMVFEAGKLYGDFFLKTSNILLSNIEETLKDFHSVPFRLSEFDEALINTKIDTNSIIDLLNVVQRNRDAMSLLWQLKEQQKIPLRLTHNDTKLSNILFDTNEKGLAVIDLDTLMPGIVHFDFGDSIRSICATAKEDEQNLELVSINLDFYEAYCKGYAIYTKAILNPLEIQYLPLSIKTMIYIMGLRFLTDHLNGNIYYKVNYPEHNLVRAKNQFQLLRSVEFKYDKIVEITNTSFTK